MWLLLAFPSEAGSLASGAHARPTSGSGRGLPPLGWVLTAVLARAAGPLLVGQQLAGALGAGRGRGAVAGVAGCGGRERDCQGPVWPPGVSSFPDHPGGRWRALQGAPAAGVTKETAAKDSGTPSSLGAVPRCQHHGPSWQSYPALSQCLCDPQQTWGWWPIPHPPRAHRSCTGDSTGRPAGRRARARARARGRRGAAGTAEAGSAWSECCRHRCTPGSRRGPCGQAAKEAQ